MNRIVLILFSCECTYETGLNWFCFFSAEAAVVTHEKTDSSKLPSLLEPPKCIETQTSCIEVYVRTDGGFQEVSTGKKFTSESDGSNDCSPQTELQVPSAPPLMTSQTQTSEIEVHSRNGHENCNSKDNEGDRDVTRSLLDESEPQKRQLKSDSGDWDVTKPLLGESEPQKTQLESDSGDRDVTKPLLDESEPQKTQLESDSGDKDVTRPLLDESEPQKSQLQSGAGKSSPKNVVVSVL